MTTRRLFTRRSLAGIVIVTTMLGAVPGCTRGSPAKDADGDDPIKALDAPVESTRYTHDFWFDQARRQTAVWDSAYRTCSAYWTHQDGSRPNCGHVYTANFAHAGESGPVRSRDMRVKAQLP
jgi:hypothetical protein